MKDSDLIEWLHAAIQRSGKTQEEVAALAGIGDRSAISKILISRRKLKASELLAIAKALGESLPVEAAPPTEYKTVTAPVRGSIAPGIWREPGALMNINYAVPLIPGHRTEEQYALRYEGPPHEKGFQYGDFLVFVPVARNGANVKNNSIVDFRRHKDGTSEWTVRSVSIRPDHSYEIKDGPNGRTIVVTALDDLDDAMEVKGVYIGLFRPDNS